MSHTHKCPNFLKISWAIGYLSEHAKKMFPMLSYTDTAEGMIIEVDAPLWRSHYD